MNARITNSTHELRPTPGAVAQEIVIDNTVKTTGLLQANTTHVLITLAEAAAHVSFDGSDPSAASGHLISQGEHIWRKELAMAARWTFAGTTNARLTLTELTY